LFVVGKEGIIEAQREGIEGGTTYTVPFPLQVNVEASCVSLDFYAHNRYDIFCSSALQHMHYEDTLYLQSFNLPSDIPFLSPTDSKNGDGTKPRQRGTDIMYCDVREDKIVRIDTLRHTLEQPPWVKHHFSL